MAINPRWITTDPGERTLDRMANVERGLANAKRGSQVAGVQRGTVTNLTPTTGVVANSAAPVALNAGVTVNIPTTSSSVLVMWAATASGSNSTTYGGLAITDGIDFTGGGFDAGSATSQNTTIWSAVGNRTISNVVYPTMMQPISLYNFSPTTVGDHTFVLRGYRTGPGPLGTVTFGVQALWVVVL